MRLTDRNARLARRCHLGSLLLLVVFVVSVPTFIASVYQAATYKSDYAAILAILAAIAVVTSGLGYPLAIILREGFAYGRFGWRFTTYHLLCLMTGVAGTLGVFIGLLKVLR